MKLKSSLDQLEKRGYVSNDKVNEFIHLNTDPEKLLSSNNAVNRTIAAKIISERQLVYLLPKLCDLLKVEKKLYTKIALCDAIASFGTLAIPYLIPLLGQIGSNQHKKINLVDLKKKSFPLPRDIIARILIRIGKDILPDMKKVLLTGNRSQILECVDVIGHIVYNFECIFDEEILINLYKNNKKDDLMLWKLIRCFQSFTGIEFRYILTNIINNDKNFVFIEEAKRSFDKINKTLKL